MNFLFAKQSCIHFYTQLHPWNTSEKIPFFLCACELVVVVQDERAWWWWWWWCGTPVRGGDGGEGRACMVVIIAGGVKG